MINGIYVPGEGRNSAHQQFLAIKIAVVSGEPETAKATMFGFLRSLLSEFAAGLLGLEGQPDPRLELTMGGAVAELTNQLYLCSGQENATRPDLGGVFEEGGGAGVIVPSDDPEPQVITTPDGRAAASFPGDAVEEPVLVTVTPDPEGTGEFPGPLTQFEPFFDFSSYPHVTEFGAPVTVGLCVDDDDLTEEVFARLRIAHPDPATNRTTLELLPRVPPPPTLQCEPTDFGSLPPNARGWLPMFGSLARKAVRLLAPEPLHATVVVIRGGLGGTTDSFTDFRAVDPGEGSTVETGDLGHARRDHASVLLDDGRVFLVGGTACCAEIYNPGAGTFTTIPTLYSHGQGVSATKLNSGRVLVVGGGSPTRAEIFNPATGAFISPRFQPNFVHNHHTATLLPNGRVLIAGGQENTAGGPVSSAKAEIYNPEGAPGGGDFYPVNDLLQHRTGHAATLLPNGLVLIVGGTQTTTPGSGICLSSAELVNPVTKATVAVGSMGEARCSLGFTGINLLSNGKVLVLGGLSGATAELFDVASRTFSYTGSMAGAHSAGRATLLSSGRVLVTGGGSGDGASDAVEIYNPATGFFTRGVSMLDARQQHGATRLQDGRVLITGGYDDGDLGSAELYSIP